jgi:hypothetical protein
MSAAGPVTVTQRSRNLSGSRAISTTLAGMDSASVQGAGRCATGCAASSRADRKAIIRAC